MTNYNIHSPETAKGKAAEMLAGAKSKFGFVPNLLGVMAEAPALLEGYTTLSQIYEGTSLNATEKQIVLLATSYTNNCDYCMAAHSVISKMQGVDDSVVNSLRNNESIADSKLEGLRSFAIEMVRSNGNPSSEALERFFAVGYSKQHLLEVILGIGLKILSNYTNHLAQTPLDDNFAAAKWSK